MTPRSGDFLFFPSWLRHGVKKSYFKKKGVRRVARRGGFHEPRRGLGSHCPSEPLATRSAAGRQLHRGARAIVGSRPSQEACAQRPGRRQVAFVAAGGRDTGRTEDGSAPCRRACFPIGRLADWLSCSCSAATFPCDVAAPADPQEFRCSRRSW
ncbi:unnamed protein product [Prorocentrum cordatum]|uniref:Uncharacterized protein n=1 Tax=Prorocentrum cordatum TaxID=2364126 RepID=A0ABN9WCL9_9DINO|nr:unnamed protein product [Polarella glacialis]